MTDGSIRCWGKNNRGQLGDGTTSDRESPTLVQGLSDVVDLAIDGETTCAVTGSGSAFCWGNNMWGRLGTKCTTVPCIETIPVIVPGVRGATSIALGLQYGFALTESGSVFAWGGGPSGNEGSLPFVIPGASGVEIATTNNGLYVRGADGSVRHWGSPDVLDHQFESQPMEIEEAQQLASDGDDMYALLSGGRIIRYDPPETITELGSFQDVEILGGEVFVAKSGILRNLFGSAVLESVASIPRDFPGYGQACAVHIDSTVSCSGDTSFANTTLIRQ